MQAKIEKLEFRIEEQKQKVMAAEQQARLASTAAEKAGKVFAQEQFNLSVLSEALRVLKEEDDGELGAEAG